MSEKPEFLMLNNRVMKKFYFCIFLCLFIIGHNSAKAVNWKQWLGPSHNGSLDEVVLSVPKEGKDYSLRWEKEVGVGWSSPLVDSSFVYLHHRVGDNEVVQCFDVRSGTERWHYSFLSGYRDDFGMDNGPRSTPAISEGIMIIHGPQGLVHALSIDEGKLLWKVDLKKQFSSPKGFFGRCSSPLIYNNSVIFDVGGEDSGLVSFSIDTGKVIWKTKKYGNDYASSVLFTSGSTNLCLSFVREGFLAVDVVTGHPRYYAPFRSPIDASVNAASPLVIGNQVFLSSCYDVGAGLWEWNRTDKARQFSFTNLWKRKEVLDCHYSTPVSYNGFLYGFHGRQERRPVLRCIKLKDATVQWEEYCGGAGNLVRLKNRILVLTERGELLVFTAQSKEFGLLHSQQILGFKSRSHFAVTNQVLVARDQKRLVCLDLNNFE